MKFSCEKSLLQSAVSIASRCASPKSTIAALEGLLVSASEDGIRITGYNMKTAAYTDFPADVAMSGDVVLSTRLFGDIIRNLPDGIVHISCDDSLKTSITCGASDFNIMGISAEEYPEIKVVEEERRITLPQDILSDMIRRTIFAVSDNEARPVYMGALFEIEDDTLTMVAVDGYRMAVRREYIENSHMENCRFIVPGTTLSEVEKRCGTDGDVIISAGRQRISFTIDNTVFISRLIEGDFINYRKSIPAEFSTNIEAARADVEKMLTRVSLLIDDLTKYPIQVTMDDDRLYIRCRTGRGSDNEECDIKLTGAGKMRIGFNSRFLLDAVKAISDEDILIGMNSPNMPCVIRPTDGSDRFAYMILPVRLPAEA